MSEKNTHLLDDNNEENLNKRSKSNNEDVEVEDVEVEDVQAEDNGNLTKEDPSEEDCCAICMESDNMEDNHGCPQCAIGAWNICCICHLNTLGRTCPICKHDYQPQILYKVPKIPQFPFNPKSILNPRDRFEATMRVRYALEYIRTQNTAIWCPSEKKIFLSLPRDKSAQDANISSDLNESQNHPPNVVIPKNPSTTSLNNVDTNKEGDGHVDVVLEMPTVPKKENWIKCISCSKWRSCNADMNMENVPLDWNCTMNNWNDLNNCDAEEEYYSDDEDDEIEEEEEIVNGCFLTSLDLEDDQIIDNKFYFTNKIWDVLEKENENSEEGLIADFVNSRKWIVNKMLYPDSMLLMETVDEEWNAIINDDLENFDLNFKSTNP